MNVLTKFYNTGMFYFFAIYSQVVSGVGSQQEINAHFKQQKQDLFENMCCLSTLPACVNLLLQYNLYSQEKKRFQQPISNCKEILPTTFKKIYLHGLQMSSSSLIYRGCLFCVIVRALPDEGASSPSSELKIQQLNKNFN